MLTPKKTLLYSTLGVIGAFFIAYIYTSGVCSFWLLCSYYNNEIITNFLLSFSLATFVLSLILIYSKPETFTYWWKFARIFIPISAVLTILSGSGRGGGYIGLTSDYESTAWFTAGLFLVISIILIFRGNRKR